MTFLEFTYNEKKEILTDEPITESLLLRNQWIKEYVNAMIKGFFL